MEKLVYLIGSDMERNALRSALVGPIAARILDENDILELEVYVCDLSEEKIQRLENNMDPEGLLAASVSVWVDSLDHRSKIEAALDDAASRLAGYSVTESVPREYAARDWPDGVISPTLTVGTAFQKQSGLDDETFFDLWHGSHTPLSLRIHPLTRYIRNVVSRPLTKDAPPYQGFVFESVDCYETLANIDTWYGGEDNRQQAVNDLLAFADLPTMATKPMSETIVRSAPWRK